MRRLAQLCVVATACAMHDLDQISVHELPDGSPWLAGDWVARRRLGGEHRPPDKKLRLLGTEGCSGSSFVTRTLINILDRYGFAMANRNLEKIRSNECACAEMNGRNQSCKFGPTEVFKPQKNCKFQEAKALAPSDASSTEIAINATVMLDDLCFQHGLTSFYKWKIEGLDAVVSRVGRENVLFGVMVRENPLDKMICNVRDCFEDGRPIGKPVVVSATGDVEDTDLCFSRRRSHIKTKAHFYENNFKTMIAKIRAIRRKIYASRKKYEMATYEELVAFEYTDSDEVFETSAKAWHALASRFVADGDVDYGTIEDELGGMRNTRNQSYHEDVVENYEPFFRAVREAGFGRYIRTRS